MLSGFKDLEIRHLEVVASDPFLILIFIAFHIKSSKFYIIFIMFTPDIFLDTSDLII